MRYLIAIFFPWISFFTMGKVGQGILCLFLQLTLIGWLPATIWAFVSISNYHADKRTNRIVDAIGATAKAQQTNMPPRVHLQTNDIPPMPRPESILPQSAPRTARATLHALRPEVKQSLNAEPDDPVIPNTDWRQTSATATPVYDEPSRVPFSIPAKPLIAGLVAVVVMASVGAFIVFNPLSFTVWPWSRFTQTPVVKVAIPNPPPTQGEIVFWQSIFNSTNPQDFREYLAKYPRGEFVGLARNRITALNAPAPLPVAPPKSPPVYTYQPPPVYVPPPPRPEITADEAWQRAENAHANTNLLEEFRWRLKAAELGHVEAQWRVGISYETGAGTVPTKREAVRWFRTAAENGHVKAMLAIAAKYSQGDGVPVDHAQGMEWLRKAAALGSGDADFLIGMIYKEGRGVPSDTAKAQYWFRKALAAGYTWNEGMRITE